MGELNTNYATKGLANGVGIPALVLGSLGFLGSANRDGNGGLLGGIFGGGQGNQVQALMADNAKLRAEKYADKNTADVYSAMRSEINGLGERLLEKYISPLSQEAADNRTRVAVLESEQKCAAEKAELREQLIQAKIDNCCCQLNGKIDSVAQTAACGIAQNANAIAGLQNVVNSITATIVPQSVICPPVMPRFNSFTVPTDTAPATQPISGTVTVNKK